MLLRTELQKYCVLMGFNLGQVEIDYLQHLFLLLLSKKSSINLIFKGGTALQKIYGLHRFSIDLDFTQKGTDELREIMERISKEISDFGYPTEIEEIKTIGKTFIFKINGPLHAESPASQARLRIEISQRESLLQEPSFKEVNPIYSDLQPYTLLVMAEEEIFAEKIRAIISRNKPRDVFDLHFLLAKGIKFNLQFVNRKLGYYQEKFDRKIFLEKVKEKRASWTSELKRYSQTVPEFAKVLAVIEEKTP
ncbi:nucleotidyl transferase AbiEii/AbiGii toxin family protein [Candidatus Woesearchaeota archaeon]|nr:nucleotidyl transferase AbiEii/AbiGii toxin family protein [Candidatus Woesearchaeota archaeon]